MGSQKMSYSSAPPSLEQYPGYFPAAKPPFWTRAKVGVACGVLGLILGGAAGSAGSDSDEPAAADNQSVEAATADLERQLAESEATLADQAEQAEAEVMEAREALAEAKREAKLAQRKAVAKAVAAEKSRQEASQTAPDLNAFVGSPRSLDPRFEACSKANDAGYGPYLRGIDPEYDWYDDRDNDGLVCES
jgi:hypothetical protein